MISELNLRCAKYLEISGLQPRMMKFVLGFLENLFNNSETDERFVKLRNMLQNNLGYMGAFTKWMYKDRESFERLEDVFRKLKGVQNLDKQVDELIEQEELPCRCKKKK